MALSLSAPNRHSALVERSRRGKRDDPYPWNEISSTTGYGARGPFQRIVENLMRTLLEDQPDLLGDEEIADLLDADYCKRVLGLNIANLSLLRHRGEGHTIRGHGRYWTHAFAGRFHVCSQWWKDHHRSNAMALSRFASRLAANSPNHPGVPYLRRHINNLESLAGTDDAQFRPLRCSRTAHDAVGVAAL